MTRRSVNPWPDRDPMNYYGVSWRRTDRASRTADVVVHEHTCPDGTVIMARSQWIAMLGRTLDRWRIDGEPAGSTARVEHNSIAPDFGWAVSGRAVAA